MTVARAIPADGLPAIMTTTPYVGGELDLFAQAANWKRYLASRLRPFLGSHVLEVGAGIGGTTVFLFRDSCQRWVCLEPDADLVRRIEEARSAGRLPAACEAQCGTLSDLQPGSAFDSILYVDVLEHIENDRGEVEQAAQRLRPGGHLIVLCPAHPWLFTPFDAAIGHFRRYTKSAYRSLTPESLDLVRLEYLDSVGFLASLTNKLLLKSAMPSAAQIRLWDSVLVRFSRPADMLLRYSFGKSVLGVWRRKALTARA